MLDGIRQCATFRQRYAVVCEALEAEPLEELARKGSDYMNRNAVSSLLTAFASAISLDAYRDGRRPAPSAAAGYSVGQLSALYAAGCIPFDGLVRLIRERARIMDSCYESRPGAMAAVMGVGQQQIEAFCERLRGEGHEIYVSNYNSVGQYSLAGSAGAIEAALARIPELRPHKAVRLPVRGAWHCPLLREAETRFAALLESVDFAQPGFPVIDNVTGDYLPSHAPALRAQLVRHLVCPVQWVKGVKTLIASGCSLLVEIGYGNMLTKFGKFIDRSVGHQAFYCSEPEA